MAKKKRVRADEAARPDVSASARARINASILTTRPDVFPSHTEELPSVDEQLLQAINILWLCSKADETSLDCEQFDVTYPVWAAVSLLEDLVEEVGHDYQSKIIQAESIVKAAAVTHASTDEDIGAHGFDLSWSLWVAIRLIQEVIDERGKKNKKSRGGPKKSMREISTVDPDCARQFHRLLVTAARLPLEELKRITRYAEIELADGPQRSVKATVDAATKALTAPPEVRP